jgi:methylated-DNA-[protein]-cysteine S-methyltransferase
MKRITVVDSPIGPLTLVEEDGLLAGLFMVDQRHRPGLEHERDDGLLPAVKEQLTAYWARDLE